MSIPLFDTREAAEDLEAAGFETKQAKAIVLVVDKSLTGGVATKADITLLKTEMGGVKAELKTEMGGVKAELKTEISEVKAELKADIAEVKADLKADIAEVRTDLERAIQAQTIKLGSLMVAGVLLLSVLDKLLA